MIATLHGLRSSIDDAMDLIPVLVAIQVMHESCMKHSFLNSNEKKGNERFSAGSLKNESCSQIN